MGQRWRGYTHKIQLVREQLDHLLDNDVVVVCDSYDLVFQKGPEEILREFVSYNKPIVISSEQTPKHLHGYTGFPKTPNVYYCTCAGFWVARVFAAKKMIDEAWGSNLNDSSLDDQNTIKVWFSKNHGKMTVDYKNVLVTSAPREYFYSDFGYRNGEIYNKITETVPCAVHANGESDMREVYGTLSLPASSEGMDKGSEAHRRYQTYLLLGKNPWPEDRPGVKPDGQSFFRDDNRPLFSELMQKPMSVILELGSWVGSGSTKFFLENSQALLICNDTWSADSPEMVGDWGHKIPTLYETFCRNRWYDRDRIAPLRMDTMAGLRAVSDGGITPDLIYVDANHSYEAVTAQLELIRELFPESLVTGDDFDRWPEVRNAVLHFGEKYDLRLMVSGNGWVFRK